MNNLVKILLNLIIVGAFSGAVLAAVFSVADPMIQANKEKELKESIFKVLPEAKDFKTLEKVLGPEEKVVIYLGVDEARNPVGVAFKADGGGFQGNIGVMVGLSLDYLKLKNIEILDQLETPGLGDRIREASFKDQFKGVEVQPKVEYIKYKKPEKPNQIQAITGATISSDAVVKNINNAVARLARAFPKEELSKVDTSAADPAVKPASAEVK
ncbi:Na(+)-translocating ferredoxin:NAD(+) oxidoreductase complex subunit G [uncultured bacterium]|nr:Na(+)-translocating ferredoxin:NAD(+) oxidoreductase complex subunit G [uncultured bacterium]